MSDQMGPGRPGLYPVIMAVLDPCWAYTPATVADFAAAHGFLDLLHQDDDQSIQMRKNRARVALGRHTALKGFPADGDTQILVRGRWFSAWEGWRWRGEESPEAAWAISDAALGLIWERMEGNRTYSLGQLIGLGEEVCLPRPPRVFEGMHDGEDVWRGVHLLRQRVLLVRQALYQGLDLSKSYVRETWSAPRPTPSAGLNMFQTLALRLKPKQIYSIAQILNLGVSSNVLSDRTHLAMMAIRCTLFRFARNHRFPENGDQRVSLADGITVPGWTGQRWQRALLVQA